MNDRKCHECSEPLKGRVDQKFCNDHCRGMYNHKKSPENNSNINSVNRILKKNHTILTILLAIGKTTVQKSDLHKRGYLFDYFTSKSISRNNKVCYYCYDHGFRELENNKVVLVDLVVEDDMEPSFKRITGIASPKYHIQPAPKKSRISDHNKLHLPSLSEVTDRNRSEVAEHIRGKVEVLSLSDVTERSRSEVEIRKFPDFGH